MIANSLHLERRYQQLLGILASPTSARQRLFALHRFLQSLAHNPAEHTDYLLELIEYLPELVDNLDHAGLPPDILLDLLRKVEALKAKIPDMQKIDGLDGAENKLRRMLATLYAFAGEEEKAKVFDHHPDSSSFVQPGLPDDALTATVPVIDMPAHQSEHFQECGNLRRIGLRIWRSSQEQRDQLEWQVAALETDGNGTNTLDAPIRAARRLLAETHPHLQNRFLAGQIIFEAKDAVHKGCSANLALATIFYCSTLKFFAAREQFHLQSNVAITGNIDAEGKVLPVDAHALTHKVEAVFFSWIEYLILPQQQVQSAKQALAALTAKFPNRRLALIGVEHLKALFYDRRITGAKKLGALEYTTKKLWRTHRKKLAVATIFTLLAIIAKLWYGPLDRNPVDYTIGKNLVILQNKFGESLDEIEVSQATIDYLTDKNRASRTGLFAFIDIDSDGVNEVIYGEWGEDAASKTSFVFCRSVVPDSLLWAVPLTRRLDFPLKPEDDASDYFYPRHILADDFDNDGSAEVYVNASQHAFPTIIFKLDARTGVEMAHYLHAGHFEDMEAADLDGDGVTEILLAGVSNAYQMAALLVLDPRDLQGHAPVQGNYVVNGYTSGREKAYLLFPRTVVGEAFRWKHRFARAKHIEVTKDEVVVVIQDVPPLPETENSLFEVDRAHLMIHLDHDLAVSGFITADDYDLMAAMLVDLGKLDSLPNAAYFERFQNEILYWNGDALQTAPALNRRYVQVSGGE